MKTSSMCHLHRRAARRRLHMPQDARPMSQLGLDPSIHPTAIIRQQPFRRLYRGRCTHGDLNEIGDGRLLLHRAGRADRHVDASASSAPSPRMFASIPAITRTGAGEPEPLPLSRLSATFDGEPDEAGFLRLAALPCGHHRPRRLDRPWRRRAGGQVMSAPAPMVAAGAIVTKDVAALHGGRRQPRAGDSSSRFPEAVWLTG